MSASPPSTFITLRGLSFGIHHGISKPTYIHVLSTYYPLFVGSRGMPQPAGPPPSAFPSFNRKDIIVCPPDPFRRKYPRATPAGPGTIIRDNCETSPGRIDVSTQRDTPAQHTRTRQRHARSEPGEYRTHRPVDDICETECTW